MTAQAIGLEGDTSAASERTIWGHTPTSLHDRYWAAQGICVVRRSQGLPPEPGRGLYLLLESRSLVLFDNPWPMSLIFWNQPRLLIARVHDGRTRGVRERVSINADRSF